MKRNRLVSVGILIASIIFCLTTNVQAQWTLSGNNIYNTNTGNVGIGTTTPWDKLDVRGGILGYSATAPAYLNLQSDYSDAFILLCKKPDYQSYIRYQSGASIKIKTGLIYTDDYSIGDGVGNIWTTVKQTNGYVGIGTTSPANKLDIQGPTSASLPTVRVNTADNGAEINIGVDASSVGWTGSTNATDFAIKTGGTDRLHINYSTGNVGIGTTNPGTYKLAVNGTVKVKEIVASTQGWPDFVFDENYQPTQLAELEQFIKANKHLPDLPSAKEINDNGVQLGEMQAKLLQKFEEMTLYMIELQKQNEALKQNVAELKRMISEN